MPSAWLTTQTASGKRKSLKKTCRSHRRALLTREHDRDTAQVQEVRDSQEVQVPGEMVVGGVLRSGRDRSRSRDARGSSTLGLRQSAGDVTQQKQAVYNFARVLGKCEAVIRTAARVARSAAMAFEVGLACLTSSMCRCCRN